MLPFRSHWHFAFERDPFGEARLVRFAADGTPSPTPESEPENNNNPNNPEPAPNTRATVDQGAQETRQRAQKTLHGVGTEEDGGNPNASEALKFLNYRDILKRCEKMKRNIDTYRENIQAILKAGEGRVDDRTKEAFAQLREVDEQLRTQIGPLGRAQEKAQNISDWKEGKVAPADYVTWLKNHRDTPLAGDEKDTNNAEHYAQQYAAASQFIQNTQGKDGSTEGEFADLTTSDLWNNGPIYNNKATKLSAIAHIDNLIGTNDELEDIDGFLKTLEETFEKHEKNFKALEDARIKFETPAHSEEGQSIGLSIEWYSVMDIYIGTKNWWETYKSVWEEKAKLKQGKIQYGVSRMMEWLPYGEDAAAESTKKLDGQHRETKGKYKEQLEDEKPKFLILFGKDGEFDKNKLGYNPDYLMAMLEYGADHGWLYELKDTMCVNGMKVENLLPSHWDKKRRDVYLDSLIGQNEDGFEKEADSTDKNIRKKYDTKGDFLSNELDAYLSDVNIGAALGTMRAMYARGIDGDEGAYIATHFFRALRSNPELRRYMTATRLQNIARASLGKGCFTMTHLWPDRASLSKISHHPEQEIPMKESGKLAKAIALAEEMIQTKSEKTFKTKEEIEELDKMVAEFLTGKVIKFSNGNALTIWSKEFNFYRDENENSVHAFADDDGFKDTSNDYFAQESEILMTSGKFITALFATSSQSTWANQKQVQNFVGQLKGRYETLRKYPGFTEDNKEHPANIFREQLKEKIQMAIRTHISRSDGIGTPTILFGNSDVLHEDRDGKKEPIPVLAWLEANKFINLNEIDGKNLLDKIRKDVEKIRKWQEEDEVA